MDEHGQSAMSTPVTTTHQHEWPRLRAPRRGVRPPRLFASAAGEERLRRPLDAVTAVVGVVLLAGFAAWAQPTRPFERSLIDAVTSSPGWLSTLWVLAYDVLPLAAAGAVIATLIRRRWPLLIQCVLSGVGAAALAVLAARFAGGDTESLRATLGLTDTVAWPAAVITISSAVLLALADDVTRPARTAGEWVIGVAAVTSVLAGRATPTGVIGGLLAALAAAAVARLVAGTAAGRVSKEDALALLDAVGVTDVEIERFSRQSDGVVLIELTSGNDRLLVKMLGRDVSEQRRLLTLWRSLMYRNNGAALAAERVPGLGRETLATLLADVHGVPVWRVLTVGQQKGSDQVLVLVPEGARASSLKSESFDAAFAASAWRTVNAFHAARFAHLALSPRSLAVRGDGTVALTDFTDAAGGAEADLIHTDDAQLLVCLAALAGSDIAIASAHEALSNEELVGLLPFLQSAALPRELRAAAKAAGVNIDALRKATAEAAGVDAPDLAKLRRVTLGSVLQAGLLLLAASAIISYFAGLDIDELRATFESASIALLVTGFVISQVPRLTQAISTSGSVPARMPFVPLYMMQLATCFMNIALPSAAARTVLSIRFFQRQGVAPATAAVSGVVDSFMSNVVQALLLGALLLFSETSLNLETGGSSSTDDGKHTLVFVVAIALVVAVAVLLLSDRLRKKVVGKARSWWPDVKAAAATLRDPRKLAELFLGNVATELLFASALAVFVHAVGGDISLVEALFVNLATSLLVMFIPVPGGIGVSEGALVVGLTGVGLSQDVAFAATISYRVSTFYLPPIWGWLAMNWMEKRSYI
jgi:glycosyltransferase 2 family protein